jgi:hypothetical protein
MCDDHAKITGRAEQVAAIVEQFGPLLAGKPAEVQGAVLADCLAIWLAGHHIPGDVEGTRKMRAELLSVHCSMVRELTSANAKIMGTTP